MNWYLSVLKQYMVFSGRARRKEYWMFVLINSVFGVVFSWIDTVSGTVNPQLGLGLLGGIYALAVLLPSMGVAIRRLHDTGRSGWWLFILLLPIIGVLTLLFFFCSDSQSEANQFGPNPKVNT